MAYPQLDLQCKAITEKPKPVIFTCFRHKKRDPFRPGWEMQCPPQFNKGLNLFTWHKSPMSMSL